MADTASHQPGDLRDGQRETVTRVDRQQAQHGRRDQAGQLGVAVQRPDHEDTRDGEAHDRRHWPQHARPAGSRCRQHAAVMLY
jgi:hypothetical protein